MTVNHSNRQTVGIFFFFISALFLIPHAFAGEQESNRWSVFAYGGKWTDTRIGQISQFQTDMQSSYLWTAGVSRELYHISEDLVLETEFNITRHTRAQDHFEFNAAANLRWKSLPWDRYVNTALSYGLGPSYATQRPAIEQRSDRGPTHVLVFMPVEIAFSLPGKQNPRWEVLLRIHHRSGGYGIISDARGSNFLTGGVRYRF